MNSYLLSPKGRAFKQFKYYEIRDIAREILNISFENNDDLKQEYEVFKKDYTCFEPSLDFVICHLGYKIQNPFITDEGVLSGDRDKFIYTMYPNTPNARNYIYPRGNDIDLGIEKFDVYNVSDCIIDSRRRCYKVNRDKDYIHEYLYEIILMEMATSNKTLYEDYLNCYDENSPVYYCVNAYFRDRLGYLQLVRYENDSGHISFNNDLIDNHTIKLLDNIKQVYPRINFERSFLPPEVIMGAKNMKDEMSGFNESRRI